MSRDFILVFSGGLVSLITTLVVFFVMDYFYRRDQKGKVDQLSQTAAGNESANKSVAVLTPKANGSEQKAVVDQTAKAIDADMSVRQPVADQTPRLKTEEAAAKKPSPDQISKPKTEDVAVQKAAVHISKPNVEDAEVRKSNADESTVSSTPVTPTTKIDASPKPITDNLPSEETMAETKLEPKVEEKPVQVPAIEQKVESTVVELAPNLKVDTHPVEKPPAESKPEPKISETAAPQPTLEQESPPAPVADGKPKPPRVVPPETIRKKTREANTARHTSKEHDG